MYLRVCKCCKKEFETNLYSKTYCSYVCKNKFKNEKRKKKRKKVMKMNKEIEAICIEVEKRICKICKYNNTCNVERKMVVYVVFLKKKVR